MEISAFSGISGWGEAMIFWTFAGFLVAGLVPTFLRMGSRFFDSIHAVNCFVTNVKVQLAL
jgi:hypothetical protein